MLPSKEVWTIDARSAEENCFFEYLGNPTNVKYFQVEDFKCEMLPENSFDYMFSFGCLCHVSFAGITEYAVNLYPKMKKGSNCFWMIADYDKYNRVIQDFDKYSVWKALVPRTPKFIPLRFLFTFLMKAEKIRTPNQHPVMPDKDQEPRRGRWYHSGIERTCAMLEETGYQIVDPDVGTIIRDPIIHFRKA
jgi:hypothetical protein